MMGSVADDDDEAFRLCFVCTGNICRSPMAEAVFRSLIAEHGYEDRLHVSSAGTGDWHVGERADPRTRAALVRRGYDAGDHRARQFERAEFDRLDLVVVFDRGQERILRQWATTDADRAKVALLLSFDPEHGQQLDVPDPYYSDAELFDSVLTLIERASLALFRQIEPGIRQGAP
jgi:protein-tyrosine phosphatase